MPTSLGPAEILVIMVVALIVLGPKRLPEAGRQVGRFISEVRHWSSAVQNEIRSVIDTEGEPPSPPPAVTAPAPSSPASVPQPTDLGTAAAPPVPPAPAPSGTSPASVSASEWGLPQSDAPPGTPPPAPAPSPRSIPAEWATPPPNPENN
jgi:Tat protein translocase TatB subunit